MTSVAVIYIFRVTVHCGSKLFVGVTLTCYRHCVYVVMFFTSIFRWLVYFCRIDINLKHVNVLIINLLSYSSHLGLYYCSRQFDLYRGRWCSTLTGKGPAPTRRSTTVRTSPRARCPSGRDVPAACRTSWRWPVPRGDWNPSTLSCL